LVPRVLLKVGRVHRMRRNTEIIRILLPAAAPYLPYWAIDAHAHGI
jgi:ABC-type nitrate/sulfonate/bicarbonate transport system permease component